MSVSHQLCDQQQQLIGKFIAKQWQLPHTIELGIKNRLIVDPNFLSKINKIIAQLAD
ncbi:MAG: hypothetical protein JKX78_00715 [Alteromonadaceae bacterium]|nr:hypothetical protein [Alteromonadaceae bacterium]